MKLTIRLNKTSLKPGLAILCWLIVAYNIYTNAAGSFEEFEPRAGIILSAALGLWCVPVILLIWKRFRKTHDATDTTP